MKQPLNLTVMMYHYIRDPGDDAEQGSDIAGFPVRAFEDQLDVLACKHTFVTWPDVRMAIQEDQPLPNSPCLLTFDDGVRDHYVNVFRILRDRSLSGLFFVLDRSNSEGLVLAHKIHFLLARLGLSALQEAVWGRLDAGQQKLYVQAENFYRVRYPGPSMDGEINILKAILQRDLSTHINELLSELFAQHIGLEHETAREFYLSLEQIREMHAGGMHFGGHSRNHTWFDWIDATAQIQEIRASSEWLQQFEAGPWAFAYPYGGLSDDSPELLQQHSFVAAFTTREHLQHSNPYFIGRLDGEDFTQDAKLHA
jgi:peptidoglycan/xylan/chitin deacetylase (PgdA/CDA1 family)